MIDCRGKIINAGDRVIAGGTWNGALQMFTVVYDPEDIRYKKLRLRDEAGNITHRDKVSHRFVNLDTLINDEVRAPIILNMP